MVCFIILHYLIESETISCILSIKNTVKSDKKLIVVDNCSDNGSGLKLSKFYEEDEEVEVIINKENMGFAKGNNVGYAYAKKYNPDFIIIMNNDIELIQSDFVRRIEEIYEEEEFYVCGPDIFSTTYHIHQNPKRLSHYSEEEVRKLNQKFQKEIEETIFFRVKCIFKQSKFLRKSYYRLKNSKKNIAYLKRHYNVPLHGSFLIFSKRFIEKREEAFYPYTFFYYETEILDYLCDVENFKTLYAPELKILHHQNAATNVKYKKMIDKTKFAYQCNKQSIGVFLELMERTKR